MNNLNCQDPAGAGPFGPGTWMHVKLIGSLNVSVKGYFFCVCSVSPVINWQLGRDIPCYSSNVGWD